MTKVDLGPGMHPAKGWCSVDRIQRDNHPRVDVVWAEGETLREALDRDGYPDPVTHILCCHIWEHVPQHELMPMAREMFDLLAPGGQMCIVQPDFWIALDYHVRGLIDKQDLMRHGEHGDFTWNESRWEEWFRDGCLDSYALHSWTSVPERVLGLMRAAGFHAEQRQPLRHDLPGWPISGEGGAQLAVLCTRP